MVVPILVAIGSALGGSALLGGILGKGKKDCSTLAAERCSKGGISEIWKGEEMDWNCYKQVYNDCVTERAGIESKLTAKHKDAIIFGGVALIGLGLVGKYGILEDLGGKE